MLFDFFGSSHACNDMTQANPQVLIIRSETEEPSGGLSQIAARALATSFAYVP